MKRPALDRHTLIDDAQGLIAGTLFIALGIAMLGKAGLVSGGTVGIAILLHYASGISFGKLYLALSLPFYVLSISRMGWHFTLKTMVCVVMLAGFSEILPRLVGFAALDPIYASGMGGLLIGAGLLMLFRHQASLGGINVLVLYLQERFGWRAGAVQLMLDAAIVVAALSRIPPLLVATSLLGALTLNLTLAINHKPGRYMAA